MGRSDLLPLYPYQLIGWRFPGGLYLPVITTNAIGKPVSEDFLCLRLISLCGVLRLGTLKRQRSRLTEKAIGASAPKFMHS